MSVADDIRVKFPIYMDWLYSMMASYEEQAVPVLEMVEKLGFKKLPMVYPTALKNIRVVITDPLPRIPMRDMGITDPTLLSFGDMPCDGVAYHDMYFIRTGCEKNEGLHAHEISHVIQRTILGDERFVLNYVDELIKNNYRGNTLEIIAFEIQDYLDGNILFDYEAAIKVAIENAVVAKKLVL